METVEDHGRVVLSYHDSLLRASDVRLLTAGKWLNDKIIGFAFEYFERERYADYSKNVTFISPDVTQFIKLAEGAELGIFLEPLNLDDKEYVFLAVNDQNSAEEAGGSHWSLLMYGRADKVFTHYDSSQGSNQAAAAAIVQKLAHYLKVEGYKITEEMACPQQNNSSDCGVYVICFTDHLCKQRFHGDRQTLQEVVGVNTVTKERLELRQLIDSLSSRGQLGCP